MLQAKVYYAVRRGRQPGIYESWDECNARIYGYPDQEYKKFESRSEAEKYLAEAGVAPISSEQNSPEVQEFLKRWEASKRWDVWQNEQVQDSYPEFSDDIQRIARYCGLEEIALDGETLKAIFPDDMPHGAKLPGRDIIADGAGRRGAYIAFETDDQVKVIAHLFYKSPTKATLCYRARAFRELGGHVEKMPRKYNKYTREYESRSWHERFDNFLSDIRIMIVRWRLSNQSESLEEDVVNLDEDLDDEDMVF
jgi:hypothetical protein